MKYANIFVQWEYFFLSQSDKRKSALSSYYETAPETNELTGKNAMDMYTSRINYKLCQFMQ
jgi:hypothetical protein